MLRSIIAAELRQIFRRRSKAALILFGIPLLYTILFGLVYSGGMVKNIPTLIYDQDSSPTSRALIQAFVDSERYHIVAQVTTQEDKDAYLRENAVMVSVVIPPRFSKDIKLGLATDVLLEINAANLMYANTVLTTSQEIVQTYAAGVGQKLVESLGQTPAQALRTVAPVKLGLRILSNPTLSYSTFVLPGLGVNGLQLALVLAVCTVLTSLYSQPNNWRDAPAATLFAGKLLPYWLCGMAVFILHILLMVAVFTVPMKGNLASLLLLGGAFTFAVVGIAALFSAIAPSEILAVQLPMLYIMPAFLFSGYSWPQLSMNWFSRTFSATLPLSYTADSLRDIMLAGYAPNLWHDLAILSAMGASTALLAYAVFNYRRARAAAKPQPTREVCL